MLCRALFLSDDPLRSAIREWPLAALLAQQVEYQRDAAHLALARGDVERAAVLEEAAALAHHRLGLLEDAQLAILQRRRAR